MRRFRSENPDYWKDWAAERKPWKRERVLGAKYQLTAAQWDELLESQRGGCAICGRVDGWQANGGRHVVDHDHKTKRVRGLLCPPCNRGLGQFEDDPERLMKAIRYLQEHRR